MYNIKENPLVDVLVVGAGVIGVCSAYSLAERGRKVVVVDSGEIGAGCSYGNAGLVVPSHSIPLAAPGVIAKGLKWMFNPDSPFYIKFRFDLALFSWLWKFRAACREDRVRAAVPVLRDLSRASVALYDRWAPDIDCAYARRGLLLVFRTAHGFEEGVQEARILAEAGLQSCTLDAGQVKERVPMVRDGIVGGIHFPEDAHLNPNRFVRGLAALAEKKGVEFRTSTEVVGFETSGRRITAAKTSRGDIRADQVVLAAGSWSPAVARDLGLKLPIQPAKGYSVTVPRPEPCPDVPMVLMEAKVGVTPMGPLLRFAGTLELAGLDFSINERRVAAIRRAAGEYLEGMDRIPEGEVWRGLRPCTPDGLPYIGRCGAIENLIVATGHAMIGVSLGPITGQLVAQIACGETPSIDLGLLSPDRYR